MSNIIKAWKDADFRTDLSAEERALLPENPAGMLELTNEALPEVVGGPSCMCWSGCGSDETQKEN
ncbi:mersacidin/lichenicidin family type 2 lantibiotic [Hyalangium rubrum]|uniref:Mersacidin/lichenicidin family type 2 lantibiotic n=1 Tax=Hyalangium rubrum TaxID=3103134 RepID=A0ABU5H684_9BACT|nr:mersacidin/lichenicidin family type 2 lantibiotic [Hyalangium sp. s54d21]MDY7228267.1 mersacidin/lichenicidin family type 2 lantibiotic [Hyalangium sp. s54d21]